MYITKDNKKYDFNIGMALTKDQFLIKIQNLHGDEELEFDKIEYKNLNEDIIVKCKKHGEFKIKALACINTKARKQICESCYLEYKLNKLNNKINDNNYEYSKMLKGSKIEGLCKKHNNKFICSIKTIFNRYGGCKICKIESDKEVFLNKVKNKIRYDYSNIEYKDKYTPIEIKCKKHNIKFSQTPNYHLTEYGECPKCINEEKVKEFIEKSKEKHLNNYDYSLITNYSTEEKLPIVCKEHGIFYQKPLQHLKAIVPCSICGDRLGTTLEDFINKCKKTFNNKYDYSLVEYKNNKTTIKIICPIHGIFNKLPFNHLNNKQGCPKCSESNISSNIEIKWLNTLRIPIRSYEIDNYIVDGYDDITNTVYEFLGDYWHGNLELFNECEINERTKMTFKELNNKTFERLNYLKNKGYKVVYIWESDWIKGKSPKIL